MLHTPQSSRTGASLSNTVSVLYSGHLFFVLEVLCLCLGYSQHILSSNEKGYLVLVHIEGVELALKNCFSRTIKNWYWLDLITLWLHLMTCKTLLFFEKIFQIISTRSSTQAEKSGALLDALDYQYLSWLNYTPPYICILKQLNYWLGL